MHSTFALRIQKKNIYHRDTEGTEKRWIRIQSIVLYPNIVILFMLLSLAHPVLAQTIIDQPEFTLNIGSPIKEIAWHPDGHVLAVASANGLQIYTESLQLVAQIHPDDLISSVSWKPNGGQIAVAFNLVIEIWNWDNSTHEFTSLETTLEANDEQISVVWSPDQTHIASVGLTQNTDHLGGSTWGVGIIYIWNAESWELEGSLSDHYLIDTLYASVDLIDWDPSGSPSLIIVGHQGREENQKLIIASELQATIVNTSTDEVTKTIPLLGPRAFSISWQPMGDMIAVGGEVGVDIYDLSTHEFVTSFPISIDVQTVDWSSDGDNLAGDNVVSNVSSNRSLCIFYSADEVQSVEWHPNGFRLAIAVGSGELRIENVHLLEGYNE